MIIGIITLSDSISSVMVNTISQVVVSRKN